MYSHCHSDAADVSSARVLYADPMHIPELTFAIDVWKSSPRRIYATRARYESKGGSPAAHAIGVINPGIE